MNILIISRFGDSYGLASKMASEGHDVKFWIEDKHYQDKGKNIKTPERVRFYEPYLDKADFILFDMSGLGNLADSLKARKYPVIGGHSMADRMEKDRSFAQDLMKRYSKDVIIPNFKEFTSIKDGIKFLEGEENPYVFKPDNMPTNWTFVPRKDNASVISVMNLCPKKNLPFILQEKIDGIEISTEGWFNGKEWIKGAFNHTMEEKRTLNGGWGPNCGCAGSVVWMCGEDNLVKTLLLPFTDFLRSIKYVGPVDVNAIVNEDGIHFLEFTPRFGYDAIQNLSMLSEDFAGFFYGVANVTMKEAAFKDDYSMSVRLSMPPYPASEDNDKHADDTEGMKCVEVPEHLDSYVMLVDCMEKDGEKVMAGTDNVIGTVHAVADDIEDCRDMIYDDDGLIDEIAITSDIQFRSDIGKGVKEEIGMLKGWGYLTNGDAD